MIKVASAPLEADLSRFSEWLLSQGVYHRITEEQGEQVILMQANADHEAIASALERYLSDQEFRGRLDAQPLGPWRLRHPMPVNFPRASLVQAPLTYLFAALAVLLALLTNFGEGGPLLRALLIVDPWQVDHALFTASERLHGLWSLLAGGQWWRLFSPDFLHFSILHIVFNLLMLWLLGGQLEQRQGTLFFAFFFVVVSVVSNVAQLLDSGYLFGGLSGVVYGLVAYTWLWQRHDTRVFFPDALMILSLIWLAIGYTPFTSWVGLGSMANSAHLFGLLAGGCVALVRFGVKTS
ncbi:MAG: rhomboid family intramembrane serine protease [Oleiphilaceae bacterium]|nr:rhomboid family intramembrane serine protease [Oleiphilaceae bacterium]